MVPKLQEFKGVMNSTNGWEVLLENKKDQVKIETKKSIRGNLMLRSQGPIDWSPIEIFRCFACKELKKDYDVNTDVEEVKKIIGINCSVLYKRTIKKFVIAPRDFVTYIISNIEEDGTLITVGASTDEY